MTAEELASALGARRNGKGWRAHCPAHDDHDPSLDIDISEGGKILLCCRAGCENEAVIDVLKRCGLWVNGRERAHRPHANPKPNGHARANGPAGTPSSAPRHPALGEPKVRFDYYDADGNFVGTICRWDREGGKEIRPAVLADGKWKWTGFPKPHPLYRLPDLVAQPSRPVLVVEGEKTADAAREFVGDMCVTTWPHGTNAVAQADWSPLKGRDIVLWPDADEPGATAMREIGAALYKAGARSVRSVKLSDGLPKGWDLADPIPDGLDPVALIDQARDIATERVAALKLVSAADLLAREFKPPRWAVPDLVPEGLAILAGKPKTGKSWMALDLAIAVASGTRALCNLACEQGDVLVLALEDTERRLHGRIKAVLQGEPAPASLSFATEWRRADGGGLDDLRAWLGIHPNARLVVIDTLQKIRGSRSPDAGIYADDYKAIADFKRLADEFTVPILLVHHQNKGTSNDPLMSVSGTAGITGAADTILVLKREANDPNAILYVRGRDVNEDELALQFKTETGKRLNVGKEQDWRISEERRAIIQALTNAGSMTPKEIAKTVGKKPGAIRRLLSKMVKDGSIARRADGKYSA